MSTDIPKKRGRKIKKLNFEKIEIDSDIVIDEPQIIHIPIKYNNLVFVNFGLPLNKKENYHKKDEVHVPKIKNDITPEKKSLDISTYEEKDICTGTQTDTTIYTYKSLPLSVVDFNGDFSNFLNTSTDICCWWCTYTFTGPVCHMPVKYDDKNDTFHVKGNFCSFECVSAYSFKLEKISNQYITRYYYKRLLGLKQIITIRSAPPKEILEKFGGPISIEEYRKNNKNTEYFMTSFPVKFIPHQIGVKRIKNLVEKSIKNIQHENKIITKGSVNLEKKYTNSTNIDNEIFYKGQKNTTFSYMHKKIKDNIKKIEKENYTNLKKTGSSLKDFLGIS